MKTFLPGPDSVPPEAASMIFDNGAADGYADAWAHAQSADTCQLSFDRHCSGRDEKIVAFDRGAGQLYLCADRSVYLVDWGNREAGY